MLFDFIAQTIAQNVIRKVGIIVGLNFQGFFFFSQPHTSYVTFNSNSLGTGERLVGERE